MVWITIPQSKKLKKTWFLNSFSPTPPPEGENAKVPPAGSHFGRYFGTLLFGGSPRSGVNVLLILDNFPAKNTTKWQWDKRFSNRRYSKDHPNVEGFILGFLVIWTTFALCNIFYLKRVWPHPQKASSIWNNSWISSIITVYTIYIWHKPTCSNWLHLVPFQAAHLTVDATLGLLVWSGEVSMSCNDFVT